MYGSLFVLLLIPISFYPALCAPIADGEPSYVSGPDGRGTIELLWSCSVTFGLCIWTAVHPNVIPWDSFWDQVLYKLTWLWIAVFAPEMVVCVAASQLIQARQVRKAWEEQFRDSPVRDWLGMPGAFFVVMGGFLIDEDRTATRQTSSATKSAVNSRESPERLHSEPGWVTTINQPGFGLLLNSGIIPQLINDGKLAKEHFFHSNIEDKGKADGVAKFLVTIQILWMGVQCLGRKVNGLPLSLLEAHVLIQLPFAVVAYMCWWNKPLDVSVPIRLPINRERLAIITPTIHQERETFTFMAHFTTERMHRGGCWQMFMRAVHEFGWHTRFKAEVWAAAMAVFNGGMHAVAWNTHFPTVIERQLWRMASIGTGLIPLVMLLLAWVTGMQVYGAKRALDERRKKSKPLFLEYLAGFLYGWARDAARRPDISTPPEHRPRPWPAWTPTWLRSLLFWVLFAAATTYIVCVGYLTVESYVSMRSLPKGGFATIEWTDFFPHI